MAETKTKVETTYVTACRVVFPTTDSSETAPLYVAPWQPKPATENGAATDESAGVISEAPEPADTYQLRDRRSIEVLGNRRITFCTFFNSFPASYWQRWSIAKSVRLVVSLKGSGSLTVYRSSARGRLAVSATRAVTDETVTVDLPLKSFLDGGLYWFDVSANSNGVIVSNAEWQVAVAEVPRRQTLSIAVTTFNRAPYCVNQIAAIAQNRALLDVLDKLYVVDQGSDHVADDKNFERASAPLGEKLQVIQQGNLGGSGGFTRGMYETLEAGVSDFVLLLDDDAISEPEAILRAITFGAMAVRPVLVGGAMLHLDDRGVLYTDGEMLDNYRFLPRPLPQVGYNRDLATTPLRDIPELHRRYDVDFNGWWMTLIPVTVLKKCGLSLPFFIKWDDIEFATRAKEAGYPTVSLPGIAVWHQAWHDKDPSRTWEEYFSERNRWIAALLHSPYKRGGGMSFYAFALSVKMIFMLQYSSVRLRNLALFDVLQGPGHLHSTLEARLGQIRKVRSEYSDAQARPSFEDFPAPHPLHIRKPVDQPRPPRTFPDFARKALKVGLRHIVKPADSRSRVHPERIVAAQDLLWWQFANIDSALVTSPGGDSVSWFQRDLQLSRSSIINAWRLTSRIRHNWASLSALYREDLSELTSMKAWEQHFSVSR